MAWGKGGCKVFGRCEDNHQPAPEPQINIAEAEAQRIAAEKAANDLLQKQKAAETEAQKIAAEKAEVKKNMIAFANLKYNLAKINAATLDKVVKDLAKAQAIIEALEAEAKKNDEKAAAEIFDTAVDEAPSSHESLVNPELSEACYTI